MILWQNHRRRIETEGKAKVVASVCGTEFIQFLAALAALPRSVWKKRLNSSYSFKSTEAKQLVRQGIEQNLPPQTDATTFALASVSFVFLWAEPKRSVGHTDNTPDLRIIVIIN